MSVLSQAEVKKVLLRVGFAPERIDEIIAQLPDPIDLEREKATLERLGVSRGMLMDRLGGSP